MRSAVKELLSGSSPESGFDGFVSGCSGFVSGSGSGSGVGDERNEYQFTGNYRLKKYNEETAYVLPIPEYAMTYNNGTLVQNEREDRKINN